MVKNKKNITFNSFFSSLPLFVKCLVFFCLYYLLDLVIELNKSIPLTKLAIPSVIIGFVTYLILNKVKKFYIAKKKKSNSYSESYSFFKNDENPDKTPSDIPTQSCAIIIGMSNNRNKTYLIPNIQSNIGYSFQGNPEEHLHKAAEMMEKKGLETHILKLENSSYLQPFQPYLKFSNPKQFSKPIQFPSSFFNLN